MKKVERFEDKWLGCLFGVAIGDALGMPVETLTHDEILDATGGQGVRDYLDPIQTKVKHQLRAGQTTDDTRLTLAVARSLIRQKRFDRADQIAELVACYLTDTVGWGKTTRDAANKFLEYLWKVKAFGLSAQALPYPQRVFGQGLGSGVAMKIAPLALWHAARDPRGETLASDVLALGGLTHADPRASEAALAVASAIHGVMQVPMTHCNTIFAQHFVGGEVLERIVVQETGDPNVALPDGFSGRITTALANTKSAKMLREAVGTGFNAMESVALALGIFMRHPDNFEAAVLEAVNAGGDTDTVASMVGAMVGANVGFSHIPERFLDGLDPVSGLEVECVARQLLVRAKQP